jgi:hypothetical protein
MPHDIAFNRTGRLAAMPSRLQAVCQFSLSRVGMTDLLGNMQLTAVNVTIQKFRSLLSN